MRPIWTIAATTLFFTLAVPAIDATASCVARKEIHGIWNGNDSSTYYVTRRGNAIWWLGKSNDGKSWANVFKGTLNGNTIDGEFADVYGNMDGNGGTLRLQIVRTQSGAQGGIDHIKFVSSSAGFGTKRWTYSCG